GGDGRHSPEHVARTRAQVFEVADRSADDVQRRAADARRESALAGEIVDILCGHCGVASSWELRQGSTRCCESLPCHPGRTRSVHASTPSFRPGRCFLERERRTGMCRETPLAVSGSAAMEASCKGACQ